MPGERFEEILDKLSHVKGPISLLLGTFETSCLIMQGAKYQLSVMLVLAYQGFDNFPDIATQLLFFHMNKGSWPPYTYIIWKVGGDEKNKKQL